MEKAVRIRAPAKVNLHLRVYGRREDGFHGLRSIFQAISLADEIVVSSLKQPQRIEIDGVFDCPPEKTTFHKAALLFMKATGYTGGLSVQVRKRIPAGAGLGGGSSDAASFLMALDALFEAGLGPERLAAMGAEVGSDVPFFLKGGAALVSGRGEFVDPIPAREDFSVVAVFPGFPVSTAEAFALLDRERPDDSAEADPGNEALVEAYRRRPSEWPFANSFEPHVARAHPGIALWKARLLEAGAEFAMMSGSGSTVFGVFGSPGEAEEAGSRLVRLAGEGVLVAPALPLACVPAID